MLIQYLIDKGAVDRGQRTNIQFLADLGGQVMGHEISDRIRLRENKPKETIMGVERASTHGESTAQMFLEFNQI